MVLELARWRRRRIASGVKRRLACFIFFFCVCERVEKAGVRSEWERDGVERVFEKRET